MMMDTDDHRKFKARCYEVTLNDLKSRFVGLNGMNWDVIARFRSLMDRAESTGYNITLEDGRYRVSALSEDNRGSSRYAYRSF